MALTPSYLQSCTDQIEKDFQDLVTEILMDMANRIRMAGGMTSTTEYLNEKLRMLSLQQKYINQALAKVLNTTEANIEKLMEESTYKSTRDTMRNLEAHGYDTSGLKFGDQILKSTNVAKGEFENLARTTGNLATSKMRNLYDQAYLQVASGAYSFDQAVANAVKKLAKEGLGEVTYPTGAKRSVEAAVRVAIRTSVAQNALKCEESMLDEMDVNLVEVSAHLGARPSHAVWQGKVYWRNYPEKGYDNFYEATGYGTPTGLGGYNCRHQFYAFFGDDDEQSYHHIDETVNEKYYQQEQQQRAYERKMREWDRKEKVLNAGGQDTTEARRWKNYYRDKINELIKQSDGFLKRDYSAEKAWTKKTATPKTETKVSQHKKGSKVNITSQAVDKVKNVRVTGYSDEQELYATKVRKELLKFAKEQNASNEVACLINLITLERTNFVKGDQGSVNIEADAEVYHMLMNSEPNSLELAHNHPGLSFYSLNDLAVFLQFRAVKTISIVTNQGKTFILTKTNKYEYSEIRKLMLRLSKDYSGDDLVDKFIKEAYSLGIERNRNT